MRETFRKLLYVVAVLLAVITCIAVAPGLKSYAASDETDTVTMTGTQDYQRAYEVLSIVNKERAANGLSSLTMDKELLSAAMQRAAETSLYWSHTRPNGELCFSASGKMYGENIAAGQISATAVMSSWMNSQGHRENILSSSYSSIGIGCFINNNVVYWVQCFGFDTATAVSKPSNKTTAVKMEVKDGLLEQSNMLTNMSSETLKAGSSKTMIVYAGNGFMYSTLRASNFIWRSSTPGVATVSSGKITAVANGKTTITAIYKNDTSIRFSATVTVTGGRNAVIKKSATISGVKYELVQNGSTYFARVTGAATSVTSLKIPAAVTYGGKTYRVTTISSGAFRSNKRLTKVDIGSNITTIGTRAFYGCNKVKQVVIRSSKLTSSGIYTDAFKYSYSKMTVKVPKSKAAAYKTLLTSKGMSRIATYISY